MRRLFSAVLATAMVVGLATPTAIARVTTASTTGSYGVDIREDGAHLASGVFSGGTAYGKPTDANGCVAGPTPNGPAGNPSAYRCLPAGATMVQLPDGRILYWDALEGTENLEFGSTNSTVPDGGRLTVNDQSRVLTLTSAGPAWSIPTPTDGGAHNTSTAQDLPLPAPLHAQHYPYNDASLFCSDQVFLGDGRVLDVGGTDYYTEPYIPMVDKGVVELEGVRNARLFDPGDNTWLQAASMNHGRWYPSLVSLGSGNIFVASGVTKLIKPLYPDRPMDSGTNVVQTETYDPVANVWRDNGTTANRSLPLFPRLHLLPDGHVYYDAAGQAFNPAGQSYDEALWNMAGSYDPTTKTWTDLGIPGTTPGTALPFAGFRGSTFSAALTLRPDASGSYSRASYLTAGGVLLPSPGSFFPVADSRIATVTLAASGAEALTTVPTGALGQSRWYGTAVPLPDGTVYAVSGADLDEVVAPGMESPILAAELFTPTVASDGAYNGGTWRAAGSQDRKRTYHNNAILLADGSVLIGGHAPIPQLYNQVNDGTDLPGRIGTNNHHDASFQIYKPPYFDGPRPTLGSVTQSGRTITIETPEAASIASVVAVRNTAQTHLVDGDARTVLLPIVSRSATGVVAALPASTNVLPAGPYLLFVNQNRANPADAAPGHVIPSIGQHIFITGTSTPDVMTAATVAAPVVEAITVSAARRPTVGLTGAPAPSPADVAIVEPSIALDSSPQTPALTGPRAGRPLAAVRGHHHRNIALAAVLAALALLVVGGAFMVLRRRIIPAA